MILRSAFHILREITSPSYSTNLLADQVELLLPRSDVDDRIINIPQEKNTVLEGIQETHENLSTFCNPNTLQVLLNFQKDILGNDSLDHLTSDPLPAAFSEILMDLREKRRNAAVEKAVILLQIYGVPETHPLLYYEQKRSVNEAWRNGSLLGFPVISILDSVEKTKFVFFRKTPSIFLRTCSLASRITQLAYDELLEGNSERSERIFKIALQHIFDDPHKQEQWLSTFKSLIPSVRTSNTAYPGTRVSKSFSDEIPKIVTSGMGWSGSGAVHAFIREFPQIFTMSSEIQLLNGVHNLKKLYESRHTRAEFAVAFVRFFAYNLFGFAMYDSYQQYRTLLNASQFSLSDQSGGYPSGVQEFCRQIFDAFHSGGFQDESIFASISDFLISHFASMDGYTTGQRILLDNFIKVQNIPDIAFLSHTKLVAVVRDPRSIYAALSKENVKFRPDVHHYAFNYQRKRKKLDSVISSQKYKNKVYKVNFEDFVTQEDKRKDVASWLGLNYDQRNENMFFVPSQSQKNVMNYEHYEDKKVIARIEKLLPEYLWKEM